jgi:hypothetical protein
VVVLWPTAAWADDVALVARGKAETGVITEARPKFATLTDYHVDAIPEAALYWATQKSQLSLSYTFTAAIHTAYASQTGHRLALQASTELSSRTTLNGGVSASRTTLGNIFLSQPTAAGNAALIPNSTRTSIVTADVNQGLNHELTSNVRLDQEATATAYKTEAPTPPLTSLYASLGGGIERFWDTDAVGAGALVGVARVNATPPISDQSLLLISAGPRWRRDWSKSWATLISVGGTLVESLSDGGPPFWGPTAHAQVNYQTETSQITLGLNTGLTPNPLTGQIVQSDDATIHGVTPISLPEHVFVEATVGYTHGRLIDAVHPRLDNDYDNLLTDLGVIWELTPFIELFARYTLIAQAGKAPALGQDLGFFRNSALVGISLSTRPLPSRGATPGGGGAGEQRVPVANPIRVDRTDRQGAAQDRPTIEELPQQQQQQRSRDDE